VIVRDDEAMVADYHDDSQPQPDDASHPVDEQSGGRLRSHRGRECLRLCATTLQPRAGGPGIDRT
jgi:hypothetical protein